MATKIEWDIFDYAARDVLSDLLDELGASYREMENLTQGEVTYSRIRDIKIGNKAPVRLSEFIRLSAISHCLPVQALNMVLDRVSELENEEYMSMTQEERDSINEIFEMLKAQQSSAISTDSVDPSTLNLAVKYGDIEAEQERERRVEGTKRILKETPMELAADIDENKNNYLKYGDGDDPA